MSVRSPIAVLVWWLCASGSAGTAEHRWAAALDDGTRVRGGDLGPWDEASSRPRLTGRDLFDPANPVRWIIDEGLEEPAAPRAFVETSGGDRLPGRVVAWRSGAATGFARLPPHLLVEPDPPLDFPEGPRRSALRISLRGVRRIAWQARAVDRFEPGTLFFRDGRRLPFRSARFSRDAVRVLLEEGTAGAPFADLAEMHLPAVDPWETYVEEVGTLAPDLAGALFTVETAWGLRATSSEARFGARAHGDGKVPSNWYHRISPAWSLDPFWVPHLAIRRRVFFRPQRAPASRFEPSRVLQDSPLGSSWRPRIDRSVGGGPLESGGKEYGWGLGVHALCEVEYRLPSCALEFRSAVGIDHAAGRGGSVRARVVVGDGPAPAFESKVLVGSSEVLDTGPIPIPPSPRGGRLVLIADPAIRDRPAGSDPLDIRDDLDWLEPEVGFDPGGLAAEVARRSPRLVPAWEGWTVEGPPAPIAVSDRWVETDRLYPGHRLEVVPALRYIKLSRKVAAGPGRNWLVLGASRLGGGKTERARIAVRIDGEIVCEQDVPERGPGWEPEPTLLSLREHLGRESTIAVYQLQGSSASQVLWSVLDVVDLPPGVFRIFDGDPSFAAALRPAAAAEAGGAAGDGGDAAPAPAASIAGGGPDGGDCLRLSPGAGSLASGGLAAPVVEWPRHGEYRFIRFAWKKAGGGKVFLEVLPGIGRPAVRYEAGGGPSPPAVRVAEKAPEEWTVVTRDLVKDLGAAAVAGIAFGCPDGEAALFGGIYLARTADDLRRIEAMAGRRPRTP